MFWKNINPPPPPGENPRSAPAIKIIWLDAAGKNTYEKKN